MKRRKEGVRDGGSWEEKRVCTRELLFTAVSYISEMNIELKEKVLID